MKTLKIVVGTAFLLVPMYLCALLGAACMWVGSLFCFAQTTSVWTEAENFWTGAWNGMVKFLNARLGR